MLIYQLTKINEYTLTRTHRRDCFPGWESGVPSWLTNTEKEITYEDYHLVLDKALDILEKLGLTEEEKQ